MNIILDVLSAFLPLRIMERLSNLNFVPVMYHSVFGMDPDPIVNKTIYRTSEQFEQDLLFFKTNYRIINLKDLIFHVKSNKPFKKKSVLITFDDGLRVVYDQLVPILIKNRIDATFFLNTAFIDNKDLHFVRKKNLIQHYLQRQPEHKETLKNYFVENDLMLNTLENTISYLNYKQIPFINEVATIIGLDFKKYLNENKLYFESNQIKELLDHGFTIGSHSIDHPNFSDLSIQEQLYQTIESVQFIKKNFFTEYGVFAFPYGDKGVTSEFFSRIKQHIDISFGTNGFHTDPIPFNFQRVNIESTSLRATTAWKMKLMKHLLSIFIMKHHISRKNSSS